MNKVRSKSHPPSRPAAPKGARKTEPDRGGDLLRALLDYLPDLIYFKDCESRYIRCSQSLAQRFKAGAAEELVGKTDFDFYSEEYARQSFADEQQIIRTGRPILGKK